MKRYDTWNESKDSALASLKRLFDDENFREPESGDKLEEEILDQYDAVCLTDLSAGTLMEVYRQVMSGDGTFRNESHEKGALYAKSNKNDSSPGTTGHGRDNEQQEVLDEAATINEIPAKGSK